MSFTDQILFLIEKATHISTPIDINKLQYTVLNGAITQRNS